MTKIGRKGFMLAEVVVVAVVIVTVLVTLFTGVNNVSSAYETRNRYYDIDSLYAAMEVNDILLRNVQTLDGKITKAGRVYENISQEVDNEIQNFGTVYRDATKDIIDFYITLYNKDMTLSLKSFDSKTNETFGDYLEYLSDNLDFNADYDYMIIVERRANGNVDDCYYYALKLKY